MLFILFFSIYLFVVNGTLIVFLLLKIRKDIKDEDDWHARKKIESPIYIKTIKISKTKIFIKRHKDYRLLGWVKVAKTTYQVSLQTKLMQVATTLHSSTQNIYWSGKADFRPPGWRKEIDNKPSLCTEMTQPCLHQLVYRITFVTWKVD